MIGNCGFSLFPELPGSDLVPSFEICYRRGSKRWRDAAPYFADIEFAKSRTTVAALTGHGSFGGWLSVMTASIRSIP